MKPELHEEHRWLGRMVGDWTYETEAVMAPGTPPATFTGSESVRSLGGAWVLCEGRVDAPGGGTSTTIMTLGYDPAKRLYVGTFVGSMMTFLWLYEGNLDASGTVLTLDTEGPSVAEEGKTARYKDVIELRGDDHRTLTSNYLDGAGKWIEFMTSHYRRTT